MNPERFGDHEQVAGLRLCPVLDPLDRAAVYAGGLCQPLLGHVEVHAADADAVADGPAGIEDPLVVCGGHDSHAPPKIILCPQQI